MGSVYRYYTFMMVMVITSISLQILVGILLLWMSITSINKEKNQEKMDKVNDAASVAVFCITVVNIFIGGFGVQLPSKEHLY